MALKGGVCFGCGSSGAWATKANDAVVLVVSFCTIQRRYMYSLVVLLVVLFAGEGM